MRRVWGKLQGSLWMKFAAVTGTEILTILIATITGFITIHFLPKEVYGNYVYMISAINFLLALSELGMNHCFLPAVGVRVEEEGHIQAVTRVILSQRFYFWFLSSLLVVPYWVWTSFQQGWMRPSSLLAFLIFLGGSWLGLNEQMFRMNAAVRSRSEIVARSNFSSTLARTLCLLSCYLLLDPHHALPGIAVANVVGILISMGSYRRSGLTLPFHQQRDIAEEAKIKQQVRAMMTPLILPSLIFVLHSNFGGMILGWISQRKIIAEVGAVSRLALVLLIIDRLTALFVSPLLARAKTEWEYRTLALRFQGVYLCIVIGIELSVFLFPKLWLLLLGQKYANLESILWMGTLGPILMNISGFTFTMISCGGYTQKQLPINLLGFGVQILLYITWGAADAWHVFMINICTAAIFVMGQYLLFTHCLLGREPH